MSSSQEIRAILKTHGFKFRENNKSIILDCPVCQHPQKLYIRKSDGRFICFFCNSINPFSGNIERLLSELLNVPVEEIEDNLNTGTALIDLTENLVPFQPKPLPPHIAKPDSFAFEPARKYLFSRGITEDLIQ